MKFPSGVSINDFIEEDVTKKSLANFSKIQIKGLNSLPSRQYVIKRFEIEKGTLTLLCAMGSSGKSMLIQYIACCISSGLNLFNTFPVMKGNVLHLDQEQDYLQTQRRYERIAGGLQIDNLNVERMTLNRRLDSSEEINTVEEELTKLFKNKTVVLIDSLKATSEADENTAQIEKILKILKRVASATNTAIILIHHKGKSNGGNSVQTGRGHSSIYDSVDIQIDLNWNRSKQIAELVCQKNRNGKEFRGIKYKFLDSGNRNEEQNCTESLEFKLLEDDIEREAIDDNINILQIIKNNPKINQSKLFELVGGERKKFSVLIDELILVAHIKESRGQKNSRLFEITETGLLELLGDK